MVESHSLPDAEDQVTVITNTIVGELGTVDLEIALTVICNLAGQLIAALADGRPSGIQAHADNMAENIKKAAIGKMLHDDMRRQEHGKAN